MAIEDYIPNVFGQGMPSYIPGLLGQEEAAALQKRANVQGLLGAALSLAQGMSGQGPRRSAAQNILGAIAGGLQAGQGAYQGALQNYQTQQQIAQSQMEMRKAQSDMARQKQMREAVEMVIQLPEVANNPAMVAYFRANPDKALDRFIDIQETNAARGISSQPVMPQGQPVQQEQQVDESGRVLPPVTVVGTQSENARRLREAEMAEAYFSRIGRSDRAKAAREEQASLRELVQQEELVAGLDNSLKNINPMFKESVDALIANAPSMTRSEIRTAIQDLRKQDADFRFSTETNLRKEYSSITAVKEFPTVETAYKQITNALNNPSAANDLAAATKFMKLLDPGSVVRESELGMAMAATGAIERMQNYFQRLQNGQMLNPAQREDFKKAAALAYQAAVDVYSRIGSEYVDLANTYSVNPNNVVLKSKTKSASGGEKQAEPKSAETLPPINNKGYRLFVDGNGNRAYIGPRGEIEEVK